MLMNRIVKWALAGVMGVALVPAVGLARPRASLPTAMTITPTSLDVPVAVKHTAKSSRKVSRRHKASKTHRVSKTRKVSSKRHNSTARSRRVHSKARRSAHTRRTSHKTHKKSSRASRSA